MSGAGQESDEDATAAGASVAVSSGVMTSARMPSRDFGFHGRAGVGVHAGIETSFAVAGKGMCGQL